MKVLLYLLIFTYISILSAQTIYIKNPKAYLEPFVLPELSKESEINLETGLLKNETSETSFAIPVDFQYFRIATNFYELQGQTGDITLHTGIDFHVPAGTPVKAVRGGFVNFYSPITDPANSHLDYKRYSEVMIYELDAKGGATGREWSYGHIDPLTIPQNVIMAIRNKTPIQEGSYLGKVATWFPHEIAFYDQLRFDHLHLSVYTRKTVKDYYYYNFLPYFKFTDTTKPQVEAIYFANNTTKLVYADPAPKISGVVDILLSAYDYIDGSPFKLGVYKILYKIKNKTTDQEIANVEVPTFERLNYLFQNNIFYNSNDFIYGDLYIFKNIVFGTIGIIERPKDFIFVLSRFYSNKADIKGAFDTTKLPNGEYSLDVVVYDAKRNYAFVSKPFFINNLKK